MKASWAREEFETINLGDKRLDERLKMLAETLADKPRGEHSGGVRGPGGDGTRRTGCWRTRTSVGATCCRRMDRRR